MKIFISWSGDLSREFAEFFDHWLKDVLQGVETFISTSDIGVGDDWRKELDESLEENSIGVLILTPENISSQWLFYEAGALAKTSEIARVMPLRLGVSNFDIQKGPLSKFQNANADRSGIKSILVAINELLQERGVDQDRLERSFSRWWPDLENKISSVQNNILDIDVERFDENTASNSNELLGQLAEEVRELSKLVGKTSFGSGVKGHANEVSRAFEHEGATRVKIKFKKREVFGIKDYDFIARKIKETFNIDAFAHISDLGNGEIEISIDNEIPF